MVAARLESAGPDTKIDKKAPPRALDVTGPSGGMLDRYLDGLGRGVMPLDPDPLSRLAISLIAIPAVLFTAMPLMLPFFGSLTLLLVPAAFAVHAIGLWLLRYGEAAEQARSAWRTWMVGVAVGLASAVLAVAYAFPTGFDVAVTWGSVPAPGLAWIVIFPLVPTTAIAATVTALWPYADRGERLFLSWSVVAALAGFLSLMILGVVAAGRVPGPLSITVALDVAAPLVLLGIGRLLWRTRAAARSVPTGPITTFRRA